MKPQRIQLSRQKGFNLRSFSRALNGLEAVNCARPSRWGNPFKVSFWMPAKTAVECHANWLRNMPAGKEIAFAAKHQLRGKNLACWCKVGSPCHADTLLLIANESEQKGQA